MHPKAASGDRSRGEHALWSVACRMSGVPADLLPFEHRPLPLGEAIERLASAVDTGAHRRRLTAANMSTARARAVDFRSRDPYTTVLAKLAGAVPDPQPAVFSDRFADTLGRAPSFLRSVNVGRATVGRFVRAVAHDHGGLTGQRELCSTPYEKPAVTTFDGRARVTTIVSQYRAHRSLDELRFTMDPRCWDEGGDVFAATYRVEDRGGKRYPPMERDPDPVGSSWKGLLFEHAVAGPTGVEQILGIDYEVGTDRIVARYWLYDSISTSFGPFDLPGLIQQNSGTFEATPDGDGARLVVRKTLQYGRLSQWSGQRWDFGETFNYCAPAVLTLWVNHLQSVVPCSDRNRTPGRSTP